MRISAVDPPNCPLGRLGVVSPQSHAGRCAFRLVEYMFFNVAGAEHEQSSGARPVKFKPVSRRAPDAMMNAPATNFKIEGVHAVPTIGRRIRLWRICALCVPRCSEQSDDTDGS